MAREELPAFAAWRHLDAREGFEVLFPTGDAEGHLFQGTTAAVEDGSAWSVSYAIRVDADWRTRSAHVVATTAAGTRELHVDGDGDGGGEWLVNGQAAPHVRGCLDVDLESSAFTNALPVHRLGLAVGEGAEAPAVYIRALDLAVERLDQRYERVPDQGPLERYDYAAPRFDYTGRLAYDPSGLLLAYPGIAERADG